MSREAELFEQALDLPLAERAGFLDQACGDDAGLRARLEELLAAYAASGSFMVDSGVAALDPAPVEKPGDVVGRYTLLKQIGAGGCGVVYLAEQTEPVRRQVALKVIKLGMDTREVITRFEAERQALAMMDHPDIARVYDAGATASGRPYFVMEFVDGVPITTFCDQQQLSLAARLELFARVCLALQHAHQKGIIHRDVKPSNILVVEHDGVPVPKVIDFGIAKATKGRLTEATLFTGLDQFIGTPAYMSPEQAELRELDIDTRSDVYALGVLLYELLTGRPPFDPKSLIQAGIAEIRRIIREVEPARPSVLVSTLADADRTTIAQHRRAGSGRLRAVLQGDLDWIVMRCLEKDRARRYSTAHELADDVRRHLRSEPVSARPPGKVYLARKFVRRHRVACTAVAAVMLSLILGTVVSVMQAVRASRAEKDATRRQEQAEDVLAFMLGDFRDDLKALGKLDLLEKVGNKARAYFEGANPRDLTDTALIRQAAALTQIGEVRLFQKDKGYPMAEQAFVAAYRRSAELVARHPHDGGMLFERAQAEFWIGDTFYKRGDFDRAVEWLVHYRDTAKRLVQLDPTRIEWRRELISGHHNLAAVAVKLNRFAEAKLGFRRELQDVNDLLAKDPTNAELKQKVADIESFLGTIAVRTGDLHEAMRQFSAQRAVLEEQLAAQPESPLLKASLIDCLLWFSGAQANTGQIDEALVNIESGRVLADSLINLDPTNRRWLSMRATLLVREAGLRATTDAARAAQEVHTAVDMLAQLAIVETDDASNQTQMLRALLLEARLLLESDPQAAAALSKRAFDLVKRQPVVGPTTPGPTLGVVAECYLIGGRVAERQGRLADARALWDQVLTTLDPLASDPADAVRIDPAVRALVFLGRSEEARKLAARLAVGGYVPPDPWPTGLHLSVSQP